MLPWVLPAQQCRSVLLRAVHQLRWSVLSLACHTFRTYEEPHRCAKAGRHESVERSDGVDVDGVVRVGSVFGRTHAGSRGLHDGYRAYTAVIRM
jgi:hypothetical protein